MAKLITEDHGFSFVAQRRWNFHILAIIMQLMDLTENDQRMNVLHLGVFSELANQDHDWVDLTNVEIDVLRDACDLCEVVPHNILGKLMNYILIKDSRISIDS